MIDHDQRFKELLKRFIGQFFELFLPDWLPLLRFDEIVWLDKEYYPDPPQGKRPRLDLVGKIRLSDSLRVFADERDDGVAETILHVEIESDDTSVPIRKRDYRYYNYLRSKHDLPVLPIVLHLNVGLDGVGRTVYEEGLRVVDLDAADAAESSVLQESLVAYRYRHVCLPGLLGAEYLKKDQILGVALSALMVIPRADRPLHQAQAIKRIAESGESEYNRYMLAECVHAYIGLTDEEWARTQELLRDPVYSGTAVMITEVYRRTVAQAVTAAVAETEAKFKAEAETKAKEAETKAKEAETKAALQTRRTDLTKLLEHKFPKKSDQAAPHIEVADDPELLAEWFNHALSAESWKEFAKAVGWRGVNGHHNGNGNGNGHGKENGV